MVAELAGQYGDIPIHAFTLMKVIGRDIWIGIWCLVLSVVSVMLWERGEGNSTGRLGAGIVWQRFPKFVIGFFAIQLLNLVRIISLFYLGQWNQTAFDWFHLYLWQALIILDALVVWLIWLRTLPGSKPPTDDPQPETA